MSIFQLTASRRGWQFILFLLFCILCISTHSLTKRLTNGVQVPHIFRNISTHSLTKRLTACQYLQKPLKSYFNSQPHEEADPWISADWTYAYISTHSLTKRLTFNASGLLSWCSISTHSLTKRLTVVWNIPYASVVFQLTASRRGWPFFFRCVICHPAFQLTASRRGWQIRHLFLSKQRYFNSQPHEEADYNQKTCDLAHWYFNSQPHEEADWYRWSKLQVSRISTHSLTKRLTNILHVFYRGRSISTHSLTKRLTGIIDDVAVTYTFQLTASRRGWPFFFAVYPFMDLFQLTASRRGWRCW